MRLALLLLLPFVISGCKDSSKSEPKPAVTEPVKATVAADGVRTIAVEASKDGYKPDRIPGKPGEKLRLVFTRTVEGECLEELKTPDGKLVKLPMNKPTEIEVTVPEDGEVKFACGMDMFFGVIVAEKA